MRRTTREKKLRKKEEKRSLQIPNNGTINPIGKNKRTKPNCCIPEFWN